MLEQVRLALHAFTPMSEFRQIVDSLNVRIPRPPPARKFGDLPDPSFARVDSLYAAALADPALPRWRVAPVNYSRALSAWIVAGKLPASDTLDAATPEQRAFFAACAAGPAADWPAPWDSW